MGSDYDDSGDEVLLLLMMTMVIMTGQRPHQQWPVGMEHLDVALISCSSALDPAADEFQNSGRDRPSVSLDMQFTSQLLPVNQTVYRAS